MADRTIDDHFYFAQRAETERHLATRAPTEEARWAHNQLAERYEALAAGEERDSALRPDLAA